MGLCLAPVSPSLVPRHPLLLPLPPSLLAALFRFGDCLEILCVLVLCCFFFFLNLSSILFNSCAQDIELRTRTKCKDERRTVLLFKELVTQQKGQAN
jgi:hypothetical protein